MQQSKNEDEVLSFLKPEESVGGPAQFYAVLMNILGQKHSAELVQVLEISGGGIGPIGKLTIQPMVKKIDAANNTIERGKIFKVPYFRYQGGSKGVILDPQIGDIGLAIFADRDISAVLRTRASAAPATKRQSALSDALYLGSFSAEAPTEYIHLKSEGGIDIVSSGVNINGLKIGADGTLTLANGVVVDSHVHPGIQSGNSSTRGPR